MRWRNLVIASGLLCLFAALGFQGGRQFFVQVFASTDLNVRPFILERVHFAISQGKEIITARERMVRRRDGAVHLSGTMYRSDGGPSFSARRVEFPDGLEGMIIDSVQSKMTVRIPQSDLARKRARLLTPPVQCVFAKDGSEHVDGEEDLLGQRAIRIAQQTQSNDLDRIVYWLLPDFNCETVQTAIQKRADPAGEWQTTQGIRMTSFSEQEPDPKVFADWTSYKEMKPSDLKREISRKSGITPQQCPKCFEDDPSDKKYLENRP
jgi:hypothetical protein